MMDRLDYAQSTALTRVYEKRLLDNAKLNRIIDAENAEEAFKILLDTDYAKSADKIDSVEQYESLLKQETDRVLRIGNEMLFDKRILKLITLKYDYHNLKVILKERIMDKDLSEMFIMGGTMDPKIVRSQFQSGKYTIPVEISKTLKNAWSSYEKTENPQYIDITVDKGYFEDLFNISKDIGIDLFVEYVKGEIDFYNVLTLIRCKRMGATMQFLDEVLVKNGDVSIAQVKSFFQYDAERIAGALRTYKVGKFAEKGLVYFSENNSLSRLEAVKSEYIKYINSDSRFIAFGPEPIFAYLITKLMEIDVVRSILIGKINNIDPDRIRERLGEQNV